MNALRSLSGASGAFPDKDLAFTSRFRSEWGTSRLQDRKELDKDLWETCLIEFCIYMCNSILSNTELSREAPYPIFRTASSRTWSLTGSIDADMSLKNRRSIIPSL